jgi:hypothetical protein
LKGKKFIRVSEVPLSHKSLNSGDVFIVDLGTELIQFNGSKSGVMERTKAAAMLQAIEGLSLSLPSPSSFPPSTPNESQQENAIEEVRGGDSMESAPPQLQVLA